MPAPLPTQLSGALFLAERKYALLADEPRVGKTGAAVIAADYVLAEKILTITTASGRAVWKRGLPSWSAYPRPVQVFTEGRLNPKIPSAIVSWAAIASPKIRAELLRREWDLVISDEDHYAKAFSAKRTQALYGVISKDDDKILNVRNAIVDMTRRLWALTGTPLPNSPYDMFPRLRALAPGRLMHSPSLGWPDVTSERAFRDRYCVVRPMTIGRGAYKRKIDVIVSGKNEEELNARLEGFMLLRTQKDVGIREPVYETFPLAITDRIRREVDSSVDHEKILEAADTGDTKKLEMHLGPLRRLTGEIKAHAVVDAVNDEFDCGLDKIVIMHWHTNVGKILRDGLHKRGVVWIDGSTSARDRKFAEDEFRDSKKAGVFVGQIQAAGEAIDLSAASVLLFAESSVIPKDMKQAALRITNHTQTRQAFVRVAVLEGSIDEAIETLLLRKWCSIREVLTQ